MSIPVELELVVSIYPTPLDKEYILSTQTVAVQQMNSDFRGRLCRSYSRMNLQHQPLPIIVVRILARACFSLAKFTCTDTCTVYLDENNAARPAAFLEEKSRRNSRRCTQLADSHADADTCGIIIHRILKDVGRVVRKWSYWFSFRRTPRFCAVTQPVCD
jgi:hypothetical protein